MTPCLPLWICAGVVVIIALAIWRVIKEGYEESVEPTEIEIPPHSPWGDR